LNRGEAVGGAGGRAGVREGRGEGGGEEEQRGRCREGRTRVSETARREGPVQVGRLAEAVCAAEARLAARTAGQPRGSRPECRRCPAAVDHRAHPRAPAAPGARHALPREFIKFYYCYRACVRACACGLPSQLPSSLRLPASFSPFSESLHPSLSASFFPFLLANLLNP
jgi:hypothetical protein